MSLLLEFYTIEQCCTLLVSTVKRTFDISPSFDSIIMFLCRLLQRRAACCITRGGASCLLLPTGVCFVAAKMYDPATGTRHLSVTLPTSIPRQGIAPLWQRKPKRSKRVQGNPNRRSSLAMATSTVPRGRTEPRSAGARGIEEEGTTSKGSAVSARQRVV